MIFRVRATLAFFPLALFLILAFNAPPSAHGQEGGAPGASPVADGEASSPGADGSGLEPTAPAAPGEAANPLPPADAVSPSQEESAPPAAANSPEEETGGESDSAGDAPALEPTAGDGADARPEPQEDSALTPMMADDLASEGARLDGLGLYAQALIQYENLVAARTALVGPENALTLEARALYASALLKAGYIPEAIESFAELYPLILRSDEAEQFSPLAMRAKDAWSLSLLYDDRDQEARDSFAEAYQERRGYLGNDDPETMIARRGLVMSLRQLGELKSEDVQALREVFASQKALLGEMDPETLETEHQLAYTLYEFGGKLITPDAEAEVRDLLQNALDNRKKIYGEIHPNVSETMAIFGIIEQSKGDYEASLQTFLKVSEIEGKTLGPDHPWSVNSYLILAYTEKTLGNLDGAKGYYERALESRLRFFGGETAKTVEARHMLANFLYGSLNDSDRAIKLLIECLGWQEKSLGPESVETLRTLSDLAAIYDQVGNYDDAKGILERVLKARTKILGPDHAETLIINNRLAFHQILEGNLQKARALYEDLLSKSLDALGPENEETLDIQVSLGLILTDSEENADLLRARELIEKAYAVLVSLHGPDYPSALASQYYLTRVYYKLGEKNMALCVAQEVLADQERVLGDSSPETVSTRAQLSFLYLDQNMSQEALPLLERLVKDHTQYYGADDARTLITRGELATAYRVLGERSKAKDIYLALLKDLERLRGDRDPQTTKIRNQLALVF
ncbi:MAG: tetratricopeptide repeat protein [Deltaproteobacteria bacterium]|jgi:hypothetical protein|nr:tetratricopeptide repeat protein [Deltaproteobacteria bacterium]